MSLTNKDLKLETFVVEFPEIQHDFQGSNTSIYYFNLVSKAKIKTVFSSHNEYLLYKFIVIIHKQTW